MVVEANCIEAVYSINGDRIIYRSEYSVLYNAAIISTIIIVYYVSGMRFTQEIKVYFDWKKYECEAKIREPVTVQRGYVKIILRDIRKVAKELRFYMDLI